MIAGNQLYHPERDPDDFIFNPVIIADLKTSPAEIFVLDDSVEQVLDGYHLLLFS